MTTARHKLVRNEEIGTYHCTVRCVRRAFLCGRDAYSGKNYDHRRQWVVERLETLTNIFCLDVLAYAAMSNHLHVVVRLRPDQSAGWSDEEVARRWLELYPPATSGESRLKPIDAEAWRHEIRKLIGNEHRIMTLRDRLGSLSWFMKSLNEHIARRANREDDCKGRFWEGRFKCQRLENEGAILACMCYVDLNPIRAGIAKSIDESEFTSARERVRRIEALDSAAVIRNHTGGNGIIGPKLVGLDGDASPFACWGEREYLRILEATGREIRRDKPGYISEDIRPLLEQLDLDTEQWVQTVSEYNRRFRRIVGSLDQLRAAAKEMGQIWVHGFRAAEAGFRLGRNLAASP
jgi:REP element-mobilizing transposase RayT